MLRFLTATAASAALAANAVATVEAETIQVPLAANQLLRIMAIGAEITCAGSDLTIQQISGFAAALNFYADESTFLDQVIFHAVNLQNPTAGNQRPAHGLWLAYSHDKGLELDFSNAQLPLGARMFSISAFVDVKNGATVGRVVTNNLRSLVYY